MILSFPAAKIWCGHLHIASYVAQVHQSLSSEINLKWKKLKSSVTRKI